MSSSLSAVTTTKNRKGGRVLEYGPDVAYLLFNIWYLLAGVLALYLSPLHWAVMNSNSPASSSAATSRMRSILIRNFATCYIGYAPWHWYLYGANGGAPPKAAKRKFNTNMPDPSQHERDRFWTFVGFAISAYLECILVEATLNRRGEKNYDATSFSAAFVAVATFSVPWFREVHFYFSHRALHLRTLYKYIHSLHHKSINTAVWSGLAMHPLEHLVYFTCLVPYAIMLYLSNGAWYAAIPFYYAKLHSELSPIMGHHGFEGLGGSEFHHGHHELFNCNYGSPAVPLDYWLKTDAASMKAKKSK